MTSDLTEVRKRAWETRRTKYGPQGHAGSYSRPRSPCICEARQVIVRLHNEGVLSEGQAAKALGIDRVTLRAEADRESLNDR